MEFLKNIRLIQGGMGVFVSNWRLARAVAMQRPGITAGTVSGTALDVVYTRMLQLGDPGGHIQRAFAAFDSYFDTHVGKRIIERFYIKGGKEPSVRFKNSPMHHLRTIDGNDLFLESKAQTEPVNLILDQENIELIVAATFAEVWLAKEGHSGKIFVNFLNKIELPLIYGMYGAMLAGVDGIVVGAGNPEGLPELCTHLSQHRSVNRPLPVLYRESGENFNLNFDPSQISEGKFTKQPVNRPAFLAIVSLDNLATALAQSATEAPDGFIIEHHTAGGHNAAPQGPLIKDEEGQPVYSELDEPDLEAIRANNLPFWLAGGYGSAQQLQKALSLGANGVQTGSIFALAEESGMSPGNRVAVFDRLKTEPDDAKIVKTTLFSPTGYPFKVVQLEGTLSDESVYANRRRVCDIGLLQQYGLGKAETNGSRRFFQRCQAAPLEDFIEKRGLERNALGKRCLCNGLLAGVGLGQTVRSDGGNNREAAIITLGNHLDGIRRLSRNGQSPYWVQDIILDILGDL